MATDSVTLDRRQARQPRRDPAKESPEIRSPAAPIARGMGLDQPFFDDKNRAFWILQSIGWTGYFVLRTISGFANSMGWIWLVHTLLLTLTGYSLTLLMASLFRRLIKTRPLWTLVFSLAIVVFASIAFSVTSPAGSISHTARGFASCFTSACKPAAPLILSPASSFTAAAF